jgi:glycerophosphoryl diester phosphodiesterase
MTRIPEIIAHRGSPREALENTIASFTIALARHADGIELDVHASRDGVVLVHHDPVYRTEGRVVAIADVDAADATSAPLVGGAVMPTLDEVLDLVGDRATVYIEVKAAGIEPSLLACLERHPTARLAVHAFDHRIPVAIRARRPGLSIGLLSASYPLQLGGYIAPAQPDALWQHAQLIDAALVREAHALGARLIAWTENDPEHARALVAMGVDALCTDIPGQLRAALAS